MPQWCTVALALISGVFGVLALLPYLRDVKRKKTQPERATWWIWAMLTSIALAAQLAAGATWSAWMSVGQLIGNIVIAVLSIRYGYGKFSPRHLITIAIAMFGIGLWRATQNPLAAILVVIFVDMIGFSLTIIKTWATPSSETLSTWLLMTLAALAAIGTVTDYHNPSQLLYPAYIFVGNLILVLIIVYRRRGGGDQIDLTK